MILSKTINFLSLTTKLCLFLVGVVLALSPIPTSVSTVRVYVTNSGGDTISVIDPAINQVVQEITGTKGTHGIGFSPDASRVYVSNEIDRTLDIFNRETRTLDKKVALSGRPNNIAVAKDGRILVGIAQDPGVVDSIDPVTLALANSVRVNGWVHNVYVTPDSKFVVAGSPSTGVISIIDLTTGLLVWELKLDAGVRPMAIEAASDGSAKRIFAQLTGFNGFAVVDFATRKEIARIKLPQGKADMEFGGRAGDAENAPSHGIGVSPDGAMLWVASTRNNAVYAYSLEQVGLIGEVALPSIHLPQHGPISSFPNWVTFTPDSKTLYVSNSNMNSISAIDTKLMQLVALIPVGTMPRRINTLAFPN